MLAFGLLEELTIHRLDDLRCGRGFFAANDIFQGLPLPSLLLVFWLLHDDAFAAADCKSCFLNIIAQGLGLRAW